MIITNLTLNNISTFEGINEIPLNYSKERPIAIIKGSNGTGKTSILQGLRVALFGQFLFNNNKRKYFEFIESFVRKGARQAGVRIDFSLATLSGVRAYGVEREWIWDEKGPVERLLVFEDGALCSEVAPEFYQEFILGIVPLGLADLFFFDGEKIANLTDSLESGSICSSIRRLLGQGVLDGLGDAVRKYLHKQVLAKGSAEALQQELVAVEQRLESLRADGERAHLDFAEYAEQINRVKRDLSQAEAEFYAAGGAIVNSRESLVARKVQLEKELEEKQGQIREMSQHLLPLCVLGPELDELAEQLLCERRVRSAAAVNSHLATKAVELETTLSAEGISVDALQRIVEMLRVPEGDLCPQIHNLSDTQVDEILNSISRARDVVRPAAMALFTALEVVEAELGGVAAALEKGHEDSAVSQALTTIKELNTNLLKLAMEQERAGERRQRIQNEVAVYHNKLEQLHKALEKSEATSRSEELAHRFEALLPKIVTAIMSSRVKQLERLLLRNLNMLFSKEMLFERVVVTDDFAIEFYGASARKVNVRQLSAGEQQVLATALQWALATIASEHMPTVIDTPLARLDSGHRANIAAKYYPALNQALVLSTDKEVDDEIMVTLSPYVSSVYQLQYSRSEMRTEIVQCASWKQPGAI